jgi:hypothetical protein
MVADKLLAVFFLPNHAKDFDRCDPRGIMEVANAWQTIAFLMSSYSKCFIPNPRRQAGLTLEKSIERSTLNFQLFADSLCTFSIQYEVSILPTITRSRTSFPPRSQLLESMQVQINHSDRFKPITPGTLAALAPLHVKHPDWFWGRTISRD